MIEPGSQRAADVDALDALAAALDEERSALLEYDSARLQASSQAKLHALHALELHPPAGGDERLAQLREANAVNGLLLAQRRRRLQRQRRHLNVGDDAPGYDAHGLARSWQNRQSLAVA